mmetsp:Transcript_24232/g.39556  ORF Transcript_24232/g.39556 Transcript_24232/m.39556 type:complete len:85 (-) Transcript_24232:10-264(-)
MTLRFVKKPPIKSHFYSLCFGWKIQIAVRLPAHEARLPVEDDHHQKGQELRILIFPFRWTFYGFGEMAQTLLFLQHIPKANPTC